MFRLRLLRLMLLWLVTPAKGMLERHALHLIAWPIIDVDVTRMMAHAFTRAMALGRYQSVFASEFRRHAFRNRWFPITVAESTTLLRPIRLFERFTVTSQVLCWTETRFYLEQQFLVGGELRARSIVEGVIWGPTGKLSPREVFEKLGVDTESPAPSEEINHWVRSRKAAGAPAR